MKINKKKKIMSRVLVVGILTIMLCSLVSALSISSIYGKSATNMLKMYAGENKEVVLTLRSDSGDASATFEAEVLSGSEIISLVDGTEYSLPGNAGSVTSILKVEIPEDVELGTEYLISVKFSEVGAESTGEGTVTLTQSTAKAINVLVVEKPEEVKEGMSLTWVILGIVLIIALAVIIWIVSKRKQTSIPSGKTPAKPVVKK